YVVTMYKIKMRVVGNAVPQRMLLHMLDPVPAHMRNLEQLGFVGIGRRRSIARTRKPLDAPLEDAQTGGVAFFTMGEQHLFTHAYAKQWFALCCTQHSVP